jgi:TrmH family RNA methyltransferase
MLSKAQIKYIQSLRLKKYRQKSGRFLAEGIKVVDELLKQDYITVEEVYALPDWIAQYHHDNTVYPGLRPVEVPAELLSRISALHTAQPVIALCQIPSVDEETIEPAQITLMLESIRDPGNLGTLIRIADWFGIPQIICSPDCADAFNPRTVQASMGSIGRVRVIERLLGPFLEAQGISPVYAATLQGVDIREVPALKGGVLLIGNESRGLSDDMLKHATHQITIPRIGKAESLNAAIAAGIICGRLLL